jgi:uncharacterized protein (DUF58 family)
MKSWTKSLVLLLGCGLSGWLAVSQGGFASWLLFDSLLSIWLYALGLQWFSMGQLQVKRTLSTPIGTSGDDLLISVQVSFRSPLPLPWLVWKETWLHEASGERLHFRKLMFPGFRQSLSVHYRLTALQRGAYIFTECEATIGDLFGFAVKKRSIADQHSCLVFPKPAQLKRTIMLFPSGDSGRHTHSGLLQTPMVGGLREYAKGDPMHRIHWKSTAKQGRLITKEAESTVSSKRMLLLDAAPAAGQPEASQPLLEKSIALAAGFFEAAAASHTSCGFASSSAGARRIAPTLRQDLTLAYEALARVSGKPAMTFPELLRKESAVLPPDASMVCFTSTLDLGLLRALIEARGKRRHVHVIYVHAKGALSAGEREGAAQLQAMGCSFTEVPHPRGEWPKSGGVADASA